MERYTDPMTHPLPWTDIGRHDVLPAASHDEIVRFDVIAQLNTLLAARLAPAVRASFEGRVSPAWVLRHGHEPRDRQEVAEAMSSDPAWRSWSLIRRNTMEMRQQAGRSLVARQATALRDRAQALNEGAATLQLDPSLPVPRYVSAVDTHLMRGGYTAEQIEGDVSNPANYDAGFFATVGGMAGPWNDAAGRALAAWLQREHPDFQPQRIADLGCGLGHNTLPLRHAFPQAEIIAEEVGQEYGRAMAAALTGTDLAAGQTSLRSAMQAVADALTAHGFAAHTEKRNNQLQIINNHCPFGDVAIEHPVICAVDRGMVKGMLSALYGDADVSTMESLPMGSTFCATAV